MNLNFNLESNSSMNKSIYLTNRDLDCQKPINHNLANNSYNDSILSSNDRRRIMATTLNENRGLGGHGDYSGNDTLNSFLYDNKEKIDVKDDNSRL